MEYIHDYEKVKQRVPIVAHKVVTAVNGDLLQLYFKQQSQAIARPQCADALIGDNITSELGISDFRNLLLDERSTFSRIGVLWTKAKDCSVRPCAIPLECVREAAKTKQSSRFTELGAQLLWALELYDKKPNVVHDLDVPPMLKHVITSALAALAVW